MKVQPKRKHLAEYVTSTYHRKEKKAGVLSQYHSAGGWNGSQQREKRPRETKEKEQDSN
jgi:hypothetical protein